MQDIVSKSINMERNRLSSIVKEHITDNEEKSLQELLIREDSQYLLTVLKKEPKDFTYKEISRELDKQKTLKPLYELADKLLPMLEISNDNIRYYSSLINYYSIFRIKRLHTGISKVYIICFIYYRYQRINDNLINTLIFYVRKYIDQAKVGAKLQIYLLKAEGNRQADNASKVLNLFIDDKIPDNTVFGDVKKIAFSILQKDKFPLVTQYISKAKFDEKEFLWKELETLSQTFKKICAVFL
jgi:hypothetical protein